MINMFTEYVESQYAVWGLFVNKKCIVVAGGAGDLGNRIVKALLLKGAEVRVLTRQGALHDAYNLAVSDLVHVDYSNFGGLVKACEGAACVVSAPSG